MKYKTLQKMPKLNNEIGDIVDIFDEGGNSEVLDKAIQDRIIELCENQDIPNKHCLILANVNNIKFTINN